MRGVCGDKDDVSDFAVDKNHVYLNIAVSGIVRDISAVECAVDS